jgi:hypothetical protein
MPAHSKKPGNFSEMMHLSNTEIAEMCGASLKSVSRWRAEAGASIPKSKPIPDDVETHAQTMTLKELALHCGWAPSGQAFSDKLRRDYPDAYALAYANGKARKSERARVNIVKARQKSPFNKPEVVLDFDRERTKRKIDLAVRHLQRQRLGPCYSWKNGYYWMGKCLTADELMAEAKRRGWQSMDNLPSV